MTGEPATARRSTGSPRGGPEHCDRHHRRRRPPHPRPLAGGTVRRWGRMDRPARRRQPTRPATPVGVSVSAERPWSPQAPTTPAPCWPTDDPLRGGNFTGQLGDGTVADSLAPVTVSGSARRPRSPRQGPPCALLDARPSAAGPQTTDSRDGTTITGHARRRLRISSAIVIPPRRRHLSLATRQSAAGAGRVRRARRRNDPERLTPSRSPVSAPYRRRRRSDDTVPSTRPSPLGPERIRELGDGTTHSGSTPVAGERHQHLPPRSARRR